MAQATNAAYLRQQQALRAGIEASRSSSQRGMDRNSNHNSSQSFTSTDYVSSHQQELLRGQQTHPAYRGQQASPENPRSQGNQRQQGQGPSVQHSPPYYGVQQYARQPTTNASSFYPSNTSRRTHKQPKASGPTSGQAMATSTNQKAPEFQFSSTSSQMPDARNFIPDSSHSHPARSPQTLPPSKTPAMATIARTFASGSSSSSAPFPPQHNGAPLGMHNSFNTINPTTSEEPPAFVPHSLPIAPPQWKHARSLNYEQEVLPQNPRERWANGLPPAETPPDTYDSPEAASGAVQGPGGWKAPNAPGQQHRLPQVSNSRNAGSRLPMASMAPPSSRASGPGYAPTNQAREPPSGAYVDDIRAPSAKIQRLKDGSRHAVKPPNGASKLSQYVHRSPSAAHFKRRGDLVQPIDVRDAALKESYDPATIARDVLINAGKHPTEPILNHHLEILSQNIPSINIASDLETIRWDLIDPVVSRDTEPPRSPARVESRPSKDLGVLPFVTPYQACQSQFPPPPAPAAAFARPAFRPPSQSPPPSPSAQTPYPSPLPVFSRPSTSKPPSVPITTPTPVPQPAAYLPLGPKSSLAPAPAPAPPIQQQTPSISSRRRASKSSWSKEPSRSPRHSPHAQVQVVVPPSPHRMPPRKKGQVGRPKKNAEATNNVEVAIQLEPTVPYQIYHCKWIDCLAELHNLQALQSHVLKIHIPHNLYCGWKECADRTPRAAADMWEHVTKQHIEKVSWTLGDGPVVPASGENHLATIDISARDSHL